MKGWEDGCFGNFCFVYTPPDVITWIRPVGKIETLVRVGGFSNAVIDCMGVVPRKCFLLMIIPRCFLYEHVIFLIFVCED